MRVERVFNDFFKGYIEDTGKKDLEYVVTSGDRLNDPVGTPHAIPGNAQDFILKYKKDYAPVSEYNDLFAYMMDNWPYRAGIDNTDKDGNVHIHADMAKTHVEGQTRPYFFKENNGKWQQDILDKSQIA